MTLKSGFASPSVTAHILYFSNGSSHRVICGSNETNDVQTLRFAVVGAHLCPRASAEGGADRGAGAGASSSGRGGHELLIRPDKVISQRGSSRMPVHGWFPSRKLAGAAPLPSSLSLLFHIKRRWNAHFRMWAFPAGHYPQWWRDGEKY